MTIIPGPHLSLFTQFDLQMQGKNSDYVKELLTPTASYCVVYDTMEQDNWETCYARFLQHKPQIDQYQEVAVVVARSPGGPVMEASFTTTKNLEWPSSLVNRLYGAVKLWKSMDIVGGLDETDRRLSKIEHSLCSRGHS